MHFVMRSIFNLRSLRKMGKGRAAVLIEEGCGIDGVEYVHLLRSWQSWLTIDAVMTLSKPLESGTLRSLVLEACQAVVVVSEQEKFVDSVRRECNLLELTCIDSALPASSSRNLAMLHEVDHHDFEIGGFNEWDGRQPTQFSQYILQHLSRTHCKRLFPSYALPDIKRLHHERKGGRIEALDIGCGPISRLRWGAIQGWISIAGIDPLLDMYHIVLERHGLVNLPEIFCQRELCIPAEELLQYVVPNTCDFAYSCNALDHAEDPSLIVSQVAACLRPGGVFALEVCKREGTRQNWTELHKVDIDFDSGGQLLCQSKDGSTCSLVGNDSGLTLREIVVNDESYIVVLLEREKDYR